MYTDLNFNRELPKNCDLSRIKWVRAKKLYPNCFYINDLCNCDIKQSRLGDCFVLAVIDSVVSLSKRDNNTLMLFLKVLGAWQNFNPSTYTGQFTFNFTKNCITIDDFLPVDKYTNEPLFCYNKNCPDEIWPALLEKAFAKLYGSYRKLNEGGDPALVLSQLFGLTALNYPQLTPASVKKTLQKNKNFLAICYIVDPLQQMEFISANGIVNLHAYSVLDFDENFIFIKNPWGDNIEYKQQKMRDLKWCPHETADKDGVFAMTWAQFCNEFKNIIVAHPPAQQTYWNSSHYLNKTSPRILVTFPTPTKRISIDFETPNKKIAFDKHFYEARKWIAFEIKNAQIIQINNVTPELCNIVYCD